MLKLVSNAHSLSLNSVYLSGLAVRFDACKQNKLLLILNQTRMLVENSTFTLCFVFYTKKTLPG